MQTTPAEAPMQAAATAGLGEDIDFLTNENHIFLNKLNYICKHYDTSFKDVSYFFKRSMIIRWFVCNYVLFVLMQVKVMKRLLEDRVLVQMEKERIIVNETADKVDTVQQKVATIERHLPVMI